jgi:hypothetical protein
MKRISSLLRRRQNKYITEKTLIVNYTIFPLLFVLAPKEKEKEKENYYFYFILLLYVMRRSKKAFIIALLNEIPCSRLLF